MFANGADFLWLSRHCKLTCIAYCLLSVFLVMVRGSGDKGKKAFAHIKSRQHQARRLRTLQDVVSGDIAGRCLGGTRSRVSGEAPAGHGPDCPHAGRRGGGGCGALPTAPSMWEKTVSAASRTRSLHLSKTEAQYLTPHLVEGVPWEDVWVTMQQLAQPVSESDKHLFPELCLKDDWTDDYAESKALESEYRAVADPDDGQKWPKGLTDEDGKLYGNGKLLVPKARVHELCEAWHHHMMHPGVKKQALDMQRWFEIDDIGLYHAITQVKKGFLFCHACNPQNRSVQGESQWTPIPEQPMESVAMDVFFMPEVHIGKEVFDCVVLCVDRHSGYIVAVPARKKGLLAKEVAVMMICHWLTVFGLSGEPVAPINQQVGGYWGVVRSGRPCTRLLKRLTSSNN